MDKLAALKMNESLLERRVEETGKGIPSRGNSVSKKVQGSRKGMVAMEQGATGQLGLWSELWDGAGGLTCRLEGSEGP